MEDPRVEMARLIGEQDRAQISLLAHTVRELIAQIGTLNAITGAATEEFTDRHAAINEGLLDLMASLTRIADYFSPPVVPEDTQ